jgi:outer membrane receptor protein involved in Fe transport
VKRRASLQPRWFAAPVVIAAVTLAQTAPIPSAPGDQAPVVLSPFEVSTDRDRGYVATSTLAGTRMNAELWDTPAAISVLTMEFLDDIGVLDVKEALEYMMNTSEDHTDYTGQAQASNDINVQIRGFTGGALGRNYFASRLSSDRYNIERVDLSRGPNSVLFGVGAPGGMINTSTKRARPGRDQATFRARVASWENTRLEYDLSKTLVRDQLAVRANLLWQDGNDWREFRTQSRRSGALALTYRPFKHTEVRLDGEYGDVNQVLVQRYPANEGFMNWANNGLIAHTWGQAGAGLGGYTSVLPVWNPFSGVGPISWNGSRVTNGGAQSTALANVRTAILDQKIHPRWAAISGPGWRGDFFHHTYGLFVEQRLGQNFTLEAAVNRQLEKRFQDRIQGFGTISIRIDPNALMPVAANSAGVVTATAPNPNVGRFYTDGDGYQLQIQERRNDDYRLTASHRLDLTPRSRWFGRHDFAALVTRNDAWNRDDALSSRNLTPIGNATYPLDLTHGNNGISRRTYLDFSNPDPRWHGMFDPKRYPLTGQNGITEGMVRTSDSGRDSLTRTDTAMLAAQSRWLDGRFVATAGWRNDRLRFWSDSIDSDDDGDLNEHREPVTRLYPRRQRLAAKQFSEGDTSTFGLVAHPFHWMAAFYNQSNSFQPQNAEDINGRLIGNRKGVGRDYGLRFRLLDRRINLSVSRYTTDDSNQSVGRDNNFILIINSIWRVIGQPNRQVLTSSRDTQSLSGEGWEVEITANPTPSWRLSLNGAQTRQTASSVQPTNGAYVEAHRALWMQSAMVPLGSERAGGVSPNDSSLGGIPSVVLSAIRGIDGIYSSITALAGKARRQLRGNTGNVFSTYSFRDRDSKLRGLSLGGGANYRGKGVIGYDASANNAEIYGRAYILANAMAAYEWKDTAGRRPKLQLNVDNLLNEDRPIVTDASQSQEFRYIFQIPRRYALSFSVGF